MPLPRAALAILMSVGFVPSVLAETGTLQFDWGGSTKKEASAGKAAMAWSGKQPVGSVVVSFSDRKLYLITAPGAALSYPIAVPREQDRWQGNTSVTQKRENPSWTPTPSMLAENPKLPRWVPGGHPLNPLGNKALYLGASAYRIHGTDAPWTIGSAVSKGCVRMYNQDVADLFPRVKVGAVVTVTWDKFGPATVDAEEKAISEKPVAARNPASLPHTTAATKPLPEVRAKPRVLREAPALTAKPEPEATPAAPKKPVASEILDI